MERTATRYFPAALNVEGKRCIVVGGGSVGGRKALALQECGAEVIVIAPQIDETLAEAVRRGDIRHLRTRFSPELLAGAFLCILATDDPAVNALALETARQEKILCNLAGARPDNESGGETNAETGDFVTMASVRRGELLLAVTTGGAGPSLAAKIRRRWETEFGPEWSEYMELLRRMRLEAKNRIPGEADRFAALRRLVSDERLLPLLAQGEREQALQEARKCLFP
ncbi:MAG: bifunctional precorrin-2 dehydrogenase/sirohydrochlorin ferrochelatase [Capsulimonadales bacterium]|nr:bifunctional precorrin-2 dehydrogenase/sirohydrochlorin ferrochelatase [Capsulimonadales bacterium]